MFYHLNANPSISPALRVLLSTLAGLSPERLPVARGGPGYTVLL